MLIKPLDFAIFLPALGLVIASFFFAYNGSGDQARINLSGEKGSWVFPVDATETLTVHGPLGDTVVEIGGGTARVVSSPCANQTCVAAGAIHSQGQWAACLPNKVVLFIDGGTDTENDVDTTAW